MFWILCAALIVIVATAVLMPFLRAQEAEPAAAYDLRVYRDQLQEVERDLERGVIGAEDAARLRTEIGRKVLEADRRLARSGRPAGRGAAPGAALVLLALCAGAVALYLREGAPDAPDQPLMQRFADAQATYDARPSQAEAEAEADAPPRPAPPAPDQDYLRLIEQLRQAVANNPDDIRGLELLATHELRLGNVGAARDAQQRIVDLRGDQAAPEDLIRLATLMIEAAGGLITPEAEQTIARALQRQPSNPQGRYLLGLLQLQNGRADRAFPLWRGLLEEGPEDAPWIAPIRQAIGDLAWIAGQPDYQPPAPGAAMPGPDADAVAAAGDMTPEERQQMIGGMVAGLEARLAEQGGPPEEWARLISSLAVLGQQDRAAQIWSEAQQVFAASPEALEVVRAGAIQAGLVE